jgi:hypothetical protein
MFETISPKLQHYFDYRKNTLAGNDVCWIPCISKKIRTFVTFKIVGVFSCEV